MLFFVPTKEEQEKVFNVFNKYKNERPKPDRNLDQFYATEETVLKRAVLLGNLPNISQKKLLFLGDDDLTSIIFALLFKAEEIMVVDIDNRILEFINTWLIRAIEATLTAGPDYKKKKPEILSRKNILCVMVIQIEKLNVV
jgi:predicted methyltransferase